MFSVYQHWDPLKVCILGRSYPPEFYSWISNANTRNIFEKIAIETEDDFKSIERTLQSFGVEVIRPDLPVEPFDQGVIIKPPMMPRDNTVMIGKVFYADLDHYDFNYFYHNARQRDWPDCCSYENIDDLPWHIQQSCRNLHDQYVKKIQNQGYEHIIARIQQEGNQIKTFVDPHITGPFVSRIGKDLFFGTFDINEPTDELQITIDREFPNTRNHIVNTGGHSDGTYCPVCPGLIISSYDVSSYADTYPGWEIIRIPASGLNTVHLFQIMKHRSQGQWWVQGHETNDEIAHIVETYMKNWVGFVEETVFDVNILVIDPKNVLVFNYNKIVFDALDRYGITAHVVPFRHRYFWDGGVHCITSDLHRSGQSQDYFTS